MRLVTRILTVLGLMLGLILLAMACGGGDDAKSSTSPGTSSTASQGGGGSTANATSELPQAGPDLSAYYLLDAAGYAAALGEPVTAVEDDGVVPASFGCEWGQARVLTGAGVILTVGLHTAANTNDAGQVYDSLARFGGTPTPITGGPTRVDTSPDWRSFARGRRSCKCPRSPGQQARRNWTTLR
jgi:hypothetical protein